MTLVSLPIIILAAGASSRMQGRDKLMEDVNGVPLLRHQAEKALEAAIGPVIVTLPSPPHPRYAVLKGLDVIPIAVPDAKTGMSASLKAGFKALPAQSQAAMVFLGDLPDVTAKDITLVARACDLTSDTLIWRGSTKDGAPGHPIIFQHTLFSQIADLTGDTGGRDIVQMAKGKITLIPLAGNRARWDLDTPEDWAAWRAAQTK